MELTKGSFKFEIGDVLTSYDRNIEIIDREYRPKTVYKNGKQYTHNAKFYKYKCIKCGNEDWAVEYSLDEKQHCGCNACCYPPKKIVRGINDITVTAPWLVKYFIGGADEASQYSKYSKEIIELTCPDCGRIFKKSIHNIMANNGIACACGDGISYPNKFMYALLEQSKINFETEKRFEWSDNRIYDFYVTCHEYKIIIEMNGRQHYDREIKFSNRSRTLEEERNNDIYKESNAKKHGIEHYIKIDCRESNIDYIRNSIIESGLLELLGIDINEINWLDCDKFAVSNMAKNICLYKNDHPDISLRELEGIFKVSYKTILGYIKIGNKYGWCNYKLNSDRECQEKLGKINHGQKPVYCVTNDTYYRTAKIAATALSRENMIFNDRALRKSIERDQNYNGYKFKFITTQEFNNVKLATPSNVVGDFFILGEKYDKTMSCNS